ncbi:MAG: hypothetical protein COZ06_13630 [Armatimonadetes bacterium CG_4_10_14_3_um_filter_66_18]|nr:hypothetical protein [Armatimonadota bacterium]OIO96776.1 MAG: hypothetical protein AUJ96_24240 [Armatimonadetes bacterium CG2_30_66_41]PIU93850.1 MAG: hypothetical protein COS65_10665 [Armatimonadetes bacterium CG06_land_8_20_14_3_00_66_21]PIW14149.1 MAG: hypothetical protein COW34_08000 [Armatimonadetes bacterium CG17_big_fil_post_rev_8_21_14_2_50_66_6]PIX36958.1 MAG: hypothetical protein COZ57_36845 [Armatimonadetes bacterium CG_4_8_14_3_um_filter_66_20]PIY49615.1 MAG: hypothetical prote
MGMKVKVGKKRRVRLTLKAYGYPGLTAQKVQPFALVAAPVLVVGIALAATPVTLYYGTGLIVWLALSWAVAWMTCTSKDRGRIKKTGLKAKVMANNFPEIKAMLSEHCRAVGVKEPDTFVMDEEVGRVSLLGGGKPVLVISKSMQEILNPEEFRYALYRAIAELRTKSPGLKSLAAWAHELSPVLRACLFPAAALGSLLDQNWRLLADLTADRLLLITTRHPRLCLATIMHLEVESNPLAQFEHADVENYLKQRTGVQATTDGVSTHFKMGTGMQTLPDLNTRVQELIKYSASTEYKELCAKIDEVVSR